MKTRESILFFIFLGCPYLAVGGETIHIATGEYLPDYSEKYKFYGLTPHIVTQTFALEGIKAEWEFFPWARAKNLTKLTVKDASCCWAKTEERKKHFYFSDPVQSRVTLLFHLKSTHFDWNTIADLKGLGIGATIGYTYGKQFNDAEKNGTLTVQRVPSDEINMRKLHAGRIKVFVSALKTGYATAMNLRPNKVPLITHHEKPLYIYQNHVIISKQHTKAEELIEKFNKGLKKLKLAGRFDQFKKEANRGEYLPNK